MTLAQRGCKKIAIIVTAAAGTQKVNAADIAAGVHAGGATVAGTFTIPATAVDLSSTVAAARASGADCIASGVSPTQSGPLITALSTGGPKLKLAEWYRVDCRTCSSSSSVSRPTASSPVLASLPATSTEGVVPQLGRAKMKAAYPKVPFDQFARDGVRRGEPGRTRGQGTGGHDAASSLMSALTKVNGYDTGVGQVADFTTPNSIPGYPRLFSPKDFVWVARTATML